MGQHALHITARPAAEQGESLRGVDTCLDENLSYKLTVTFLDFDG
jgi:hypothetical protein